MRSLGCPLRDYLNLIVTNSIMSKLLDDTSIINNLQHYIYRINFIIN